MLPPLDPIAIAVIGVVVVLVFWTWAIVRVGDRYDRRR
jgi:hypothetical protein